ncbi:MAG: hypothetical protein QM691_14535 [Opitutaceae bacterium]
MVIINAPERDHRHSRLGEDRVEDLAVAVGEALLPLVGQAVGKRIRSLFD